MQSKQTTAVITTMTTIYMCIRGEGSWWCPLVLSCLVCLVVVVVVVVVVVSLSLSLSLGFVLLKTIPFLFRLFFYSR